MADRGIRLGVVRWAALVWIMLPVAPAGAQAIWRLEQPPPPPGAPFSVALGKPGDLQFYAPNRGLLGVEGNATIPRGLFHYDGERWKQLSTVCGGPGDTMRIAWAGPAEWWTVSEPSRPRIGSGTTLCRFKDGEVVASYGTAEQDPDPYRQMNSATCDGPDDCWFGGVGDQDATGERVGAFHLHWDGRSLRTVYGPQGRGVSDVEAHQGTVFESTLVGRRREDRQNPVDLAEPETRPRLLHRIDGEAFANDPFLPRDRFVFGGEPPVPTQVPDDGTELLGLDSDGTNLWAVGGGAASGPSAPADAASPRVPIAARLVGGVFSELELPAGAFTTGERFADVAAVPGTDTAWATVVPFADRDRTSVKARVARLGADGQADVVSLPASGSGRGSAARIAFTGPDDGWMVTTAGWLFHYSAGSPAGPRDGDPHFDRLITFRPNEAAEQFVPDAPPVDDSQLFAPPTVVPEVVAATPAPPVTRLKKLLQQVKVRRRGRTLVMSFRSIRRARIGLLARRRGTLVARTKTRTFKAGRHTLKLKLDPRRWPTALRFSIRELDVEAAPPGGIDSDSVTTGPAPGAPPTTGADPAAGAAPNPGTGPDSVATRRPTGSRRR